jgi:predicted dehydrogenase
MPFEGFMLALEEPIIARYLVHHFDLCRYVLGTVFGRIRARSWNPGWSRFAGNASAVVELETVDGAVVIHRSSWCATGRPTQWEGTWEIDGELGAIGWNDDVVSLRLLHPFATVDVPGMCHRDGHLEAVPEPLALSQRAAVLERFVGALGAGVQPEPGPEDALGTLRLLVAALVSARAGGEWVTVAEASESARLGAQGLIMGEG